MKFTLSSLKNYLDTQANAAQISSCLTNIGLEVESLQDSFKILENFSVAKIIEAARLENSNKLQTCKVQTADSTELLQIICGAKNARAGLKVAYAKIGSVIPGNGLVIKKAKIAGVESSGMLCSAAELGLGGDGEGIIEIDEKYEIGTKISEIFKSETVFEINVTPNRGDCLGVEGIARDLAAAGIGKIKNQEAALEKGQFSFPIKIQNEAPEICSFAAFRYFKNVKNCESPKWLKEELSSLGINSISAIVDITNYVMMMLNRPMHAYDAAKIKGALNIRFAKNEEKFTSLKSEEYVLDEKTLVICDDEKPVGIAGIIGSANSSCNLETTEILLESAFFDSASIARTGRKLNLQTDARYRFERGVDVSSCKVGIEMATKLILEICGGQFSEIEVNGKESTLKKLEFDFTKIKKLIGVEVAFDKALQILSDLKFNPEKISDSKISITIPSHRHDIFSSEDLVEEVIRILGYDKISKERLPDAEIKISQNILHEVRSALTSQGLTEIISWSFCDEELIKSFGEKSENLLLANPISSDLNHLRTTLLVGLISSYKKNTLRNFSDLSLFEIGNIFTENSQKLMISGLRAGKNKEQNHYHDERDFDIFDVKKDFFEVVKTFGLNPESLQIGASNAPKYYHPYRFAEVKLGKNLIGYFGEIHPIVVKKFDLKNRINVFEIFIENLPSQAKSAAKKAFKINDLPIVQRDFAFLVDRNLQVSDLIKSVKSCDPMIKSVNIFDIYLGKNIDADKKSIALRVEIEPLDKTLTSAEIDALSAKIISKITTSHQATLRDGS